jgi:hypothetical protein
VIDYTFSRFEEELERSHTGPEETRQAVTRDRARAVADLCFDFLELPARGHGFAALPVHRSEAAELETQHRDLTKKLAASEPRAMKLRLRDTRRFLETRMQNLQSMFGGEPRLPRAAIARHVQKITLKPAGKSYIASGVWNWLGGVAVRMVPGARIAPGVYITLVYRWLLEGSSKNYKLKRLKCTQASVGASFCSRASAHVDLVDGET